MLDFYLYTCTNEQNARLLHQLTFLYERTLVGDISIPFLEKNWDCTACLCPTERTLGLSLFYLFLYLDLYARGDDSLIS